MRKSKKIGRFLRQPAQSLPVKRSSWTCYYTPCSDYRAWVEGYPQLGMAKIDVEIAAKEINKKG